MSNRTSTPYTYPGESTKAARRRTRWVNREYARATRTDTGTGTSSKVATGALILAAVIVIAALISGHGDLLVALIPVLAVCGGIMFAPKS
jgi:hypothetical protein